MLPDNSVTVTSIEELLLAGASVLENDTPEDIDIVEDLGSTVRLTGPGMREHGRKRYDAFRTDLRTAISDLRKDFDLSDVPDPVVSGNCDDEMLEIRIDWTPLCRRTLCCRSRKTVFAGMLFAIAVMSGLALAVRAVRAMYGNPFAVQSRIQKLSSAIETIFYHATSDQGDAVVYEKPIGRFIAGADPDDGFDVDDLADGVSVGLAMRSLERRRRSQYLETPVDGRYEIAGIIFEPEAVCLRIREDGREADVSLHLLCRDEVRELLTAVHRLEEEVGAPFSMNLNINAVHNGRRLMMLELVGCSEPRNKSVPLLSLLKKLRVEK